MVDRSDVERPDAFTAFLLRGVIGGANRPSLGQFTDEEKSYHRGQLYNDQKKAKNDGGKGTAKTVGQNAPQSERVSAKIAAETGVDEKTIRRDAQFAEAVDSLATHAPLPFGRFFCV
jgi:hypothetical protein